MMAVPGSLALGRGVVLTADDVIPPAWAKAQVVDVDEATMAAPAATVAALHEAWATRTPVVVRLGVDPDQFRAPLSISGDVWRLAPDFELWADRLHFLVWANAYDARNGIEATWWWGRKALRLGASPVGDSAGDGKGDEAGDVILPDGSVAWIDGGPREPLDPAALDGCAVVHREAIEWGRLVADAPPCAVTADLAPDQLAAVASARGAARIIAPAGSGKTRVLTERLRHLIVDRGYEREGVLALAYNKRAQIEMEERTTDFRPRVATLNALGYRLLAEASSGRGPRLLDERDVRRIVDDLVPSRPRRANTDPIAPYLEGLSAIRLGLRDPSDVEDERDDVPGLAAAFDPYRAALRKAGAVDFDEQIYGAVEVLLADGEFRRRTQMAHRHLLVDELQDLTPAHVLLVRLLAAPGLEVFGVGDDDQVIYGHAGADPAFLIGFDQLFPGAASHPLEANYRCPVAVVDATNHLLGYNRRRVAKAIRPGPEAASGAESLSVRRHPPEAGASALVEIVQGWLAEGAEASSMAVLTRVNSLLLAPHVALVEAGVAVNSTLPADVLQRTGMRAALAYLRLGASPTRLQPDDLQEVLRRPSRGFPQWIGKWLQRTMSIADLRAVVDRIDDAKVGAKLEGLADDVQAVADAVAHGTTRQALAVIADDVGLAGAMSMLDGSKGGQTASQLDDLDALSQVADLHPDPATFEAWLRGVLARPPGLASGGVGSASEQPPPDEEVRDEVAPITSRNPVSDDEPRNLVANFSGGERQGLGPKGGAAERGRKKGVTLSTVHRVKGMEWDRVIVAGVTAGVLPHRLSENEEEERRVLHVAITRGRQRVVVLADATRPSSFLGELDGSAPVRAVAVARPPGRIEVTPIPKRDRQTKAATLGDPSSPEVAAADEALRAWRLERARSDKVAPFIIASNALVRAIAERRPTTASELFAIHGMGPTKLDLYGDQILSILDAL